MKTSLILLFTITQLLTFAEDEAKFKQLGKYKYHSKKINALAFDTSESILASSDKEGKVVLTDLDSGKLIVEFNGHTRAATSLSFSLDNSLLASGSDDRTVIIWDLNTKSKVKTIGPVSGFVTGLSFSADSKSLYVSDFRGNVSKWSLGDFSKISEFKAHDRGLTVMKKSRNGNFLATGARDKLVKIWNVESGDLLFELKGHSGVITDIQFSKADKKLVSVSKNNEIKLWNIETGELIKDMSTGLDEKINAVEFNADFESIIVGGSKSQATVLSLVGTNEGQSIQSAVLGITDLDVALKSQKLAVGGENGSVEIYDISNVLGRDIIKDSLRDYALAGDELMVEQLLNNDADVNVLLPKRITILSYLLKNSELGEEKTLKIVEILAKYGAKFNIKDIYGQDSYDLALKDQRFPKISEFLKNTQDVRNESLIEASESNDVEKVQSALSSGADVNYINYWDSTALMFAAENNFSDIAKLILSQRLLDIEFKNESGQRALGIALDNGSDSVAALIEQEIANRKEADFYIKNAIIASNYEWLVKGHEQRGTIPSEIDGKLPLEVALSGFDLNILKFLLDVGQNPIALNAQGVEPLFYAQNIESVELLIEYGADITSKINGCTGLLYEIVKEDNLKFFKAIVDKYNLPFVRASGCEPQDNILVVAMENDSNKIGKYLVSKTPIDLNATNVDGETSLQIATKLGNKKFAKALVIKGADVNKQEKGSKSALFYAVEYNDHVLVNLLLNNGADPHGDIEGKTLLSMAVDNMNYEILEKLFPLIDVSKIRSTDIVNWYADSIVTDNILFFNIVKSANLDINSQTEEDGYSVLHDIILQDGSFEQVQFAIKNGVSVDLVTNENLSALFVSIFKHRLDLVKFFTSNLQDIDIVGTKYNMTPYLYTAWQGNLQILKYLVNRGADQNVVDSDGWNAVALSVNKHLEDMTEYLLETGVKIDLTFSNGVKLVDHVIALEDNYAAFFIKLIHAKRLELLQAVKNENVELYRELLPSVHGLEWSITDGSAPLIEAVKLKNITLVKLIIENGVDANLKDQDNKTALLHAVESRDLKVVEALKGPKYHPNDIAIENTYVDFAVGSKHICAVDSRSKLWCWGENEFGQLGTGDNEAYATPQLVMKDVIEVKSGYYHTCALKKNRELFCWGGNKRGQLAINSQDDMSNVPNMITSYLAGGFELGAESTCISNASDMWCAGLNVEGTLGVDDTTLNIRSFKETNISKSHSIKKVYEAKGYNRCVLTDSGETFCWGYNSDSAVSSNGGTYISIPVELDVPFRTISAQGGLKHTCYLSTNNEVFCRGSNERGTTGNEDPAINKLSFVTEDVTQLSVGPMHNCALKEDKSVYCWGKKDNNTLGNGETSGSTHLPIKVEGLKNITNLKSNWNGTCALDNSGKLFCWGASFVATSVGEQIKSNSNVYKVVHMSGDISNELIKENRWDLIKVLSDLGVITVDKGDGRIPNDLLHILLKGTLTI